jgi:Protein of unknown function (DUF1573)
MKSFIYCLFSGCLLFSACNTQKVVTQVAPTAVKTPVPIITFDKAIVDFGKLVVGEKHPHTFKFTNTGNADLIIEIVSGCDCTEILSYPQMTPIKPGQGGEIKIIYDSGKSKDKLGEQIIDLNVIGNTDPIVVEAKFKVNIIKPTETKMAAPAQKAAQPQGMVAEPK